MKKGLILDRRAAVLAMQVCRSLARRGYGVDIFGERNSPAFHSRFCRRRIVSPQWSETNHVIDALAWLVEHGEYDAIFVCNEEILERILPFAGSGSWGAL